MNHVKFDGKVGQIGSEFLDSIMHLDFGEDVLIEMIYEEISRKKTLKEEVFGHMLAYVRLHLGKYIDIESVIKHYLYKRNMVIVKYKDIKDVLNIALGIDDWDIIYDKYLKNTKIDPEDDDYINVCDVILEHHLEKAT